MPALLYFRGSELFTLSNAEGQLRHHHRKDTGLQPLKKVLLIYFSSLPSHLDVN
jgi:hypothetical protein